MTVLVFAFTLFVSAFLLFLVQPMIGKMLLPKFGGTPAVWNACMVFFQALLLAGYGYAHAATRRWGARRQTVLHLVLLLTPFLILPLAVTQDPPGEGNPALWLLWMLLLAVGLPFFVVAASAPLLQKWFAETGHPAAQDPYFLYAASNLGSLLALLAYPTVIEPYFRLRQQSYLWTGGYALLALLTAGCALVVWLASRQAGGKQNADARPSPLAPRPSPLSAPTLFRRLHWIALAFVPSSLLLGATTYLSTDVAAFPLIWVVPLTLYLLSFILVFSRLPGWVRVCARRALPLLVLPLTLAILLGLNAPLGPIIPLHLTTLFLAALVCHGELARDRPDPRHLTEFYLWMSFGGVLGGVFNALVAPLLFQSNVEYPLALVFACLLMPNLQPRLLKQGGDDPHQAISRWLDLLLPVLLGLLIVGIIFWMDFDEGQSMEALSDWLRRYCQSSARLQDFAELVPDKTVFANIVMYGFPALLCFTFVSRPLRFGLGLGAVLLAGAIQTSCFGDDIPYRQRSFFGTLKIKKTRDYHYLYHGTTLHGQQQIDQDGQAVRNAEPLTYYHRTGPIGQLFTALRQNGRKGPTALIGLGTGSLAYYGEPGQEFVFYEIDPAVKEIAENSAYFTYVEDAKRRGVQLDVVLGDARLSLQKPIVPDGRYQVIVVDAFSSDAIPIHLITREALQLYVQKLAPGGILAFHISNRYLDLEPVLANLAEDAGLEGLVQHDYKEKGYPGKSSSSWVLLAHAEADFDLLATHVQKQENEKDRGEPQKKDLEKKAYLHWQRLDDRQFQDEQAVLRKKKVGVWSDDFSNILSVLNW